MIRESLEKRRHQGFLKYTDLLPIDLDLPCLALGAGGNALVRCEHLAKALDILNLYVKDESRNPRGTFNDKYASVGENVADKFGDSCLIARGGNMGAAASAYLTFPTPHSSSLGNL